MKDESRKDAQLSNQLSPDLRYNFVSCLIDSAGWTFGMAFFSTATIVPAFLTRLGAGNILIGVLPALITLGYTVPGAFVAHRISALPLARAWLFPVAIVERVPLLLMGLAALSLRGNLLLWTFIVLYCIHAVTLGLNQPAYWVVIAKSIPELVRGRLFGFAGLFGGICGFAVLPIAARLLSGHGACLVRGFGWCFVVGALIEFCSVLPLGFLKEPLSERPLTIHDQSARAGGFRKIWANSPAFRHFITGQALFSLWMISMPFYLLDGIRRLFVTTHEIAVFTAVGVIVAALGSSLCGLVSDRKGNKTVLLLSSAAGFAASSYALIVSSSVLLAIVFACSSFAMAGVGIAGYNITMEFAASDQEIPHYTAFYNLVMAPIRAIAMVAGGVISERVNFPAVFAISAAAAALSFAFTWRLKEPRHTNRQTHLQEP